MRSWMMAALLGVSALSFAQQPKDSTTLRTTLLQGLKETHNEKNWFVSEKEAAAGLTGEQAAWSDGKNHSVGQLVKHLNYWNGSNLAGIKKRDFNKVPENDDTFKFEAKEWEAAQKEFDRVMTELEGVVQSADEATLVKLAPTMMRIAQHNAYHIGEMVTSRKRQGSWNPETGVK